MGFNLPVMAGGLKRRVPDVPGVVFDGTNDYLTRGADLTSNADGKLGIVSFWIFPNSFASASTIYTKANNVFEIIINTSGTIFVNGRNTSNSAILQLASDTSALVTGQWQQVLISWDMAGASHMYVCKADGTENEVNNQNTFTDDTIDYTSTDHGIGATAAGGSKLNSDIAQFYFNNQEFIDLSSSTNRDKFRNLLATRTLPVDFGSTGLTPTGTAPRIFLNNSLATWHTNLGTGGGFTENGALTAAPTSPSD